MNKTDLRRQRVLQSYYEANDIIPSFREAMMMFGFRSTNAVHRLYKRFLEEDVLKKVGSRYAPGDKFWL